MTRAQPVPVGAKGARCVAHHSTLRREARPSEDALTAGAAVEPGIAKAANVVATEAPCRGGDTGNAEAVLGIGTGIVGGAPNRDLVGAWT